MTTEEELKDLRRQFEEGVKRGRLESRVNVINYAVLSVVGLVALVYGFFQQTSAQKEKIVAEVTRVISDKEIVVLKKQILVLKEENLVEIEKSKACEKAMADLQSKNKKVSK